MSRMERAPSWRQVTDSGKRPLRRPARSAHAIVAGTAGVVGFVMARTTDLREFPPRVVALDGDDTLWHNETIFTTSHDQFRDLLTRHVEIDRAGIDEHLLAVERRNLRTYGYGIKGFVLSMIETAIEVTQGKIPAEDIDAILRF